MFCLSQSGRYQHWLGCGWALSTARQMGIGRKENKDQSENENEELDKIDFAGVELLFPIYAICNAAVLNKTKVIV